MSGLPCSRCLDEPCSCSPHTRGVPCHSPGCPECNPPIDQMQAVTKDGRVVDGDWTPHTVHVPLADPETIPVRSVIHFTVTIPVVEPPPDYAEKALRRLRREVKFSFGPDATVEPHIGLPPLEPMTSEEGTKMCTCGHQASSHIRHWVNIAGDQPHVWDARTDRKMMCVGLLCDCTEFEPIEP